MCNRFKYKKRTRKKQIPQPPILSNFLSQSCTVPVYASHPQPPAPSQKSTNPNPNHQTGNAALVNCTDELANASKWSVCSLEIRSTHTRFSLCCALAPFFSLALLPNNNLSFILEPALSHSSSPFPLLVFLFPLCQAAASSTHPLTG